RKTMPSRFIVIDPRKLHVHPCRPSGADPAKLQRQIAAFGRSAVGMPPILVYEGTDGEFQIWNGVTRATRIAKLAPGTLVPVEICGRLRAKFASTPTVEELMP